MFGLIAKLAEILSSYWGRFLDGRHVDKDAEVARHLVRVAVALQELCVRGERLLGLAERLLAGDDVSAEFAAVLREQTRAVDELRAALGDSAGLLATVDARFYVDLAPLVDAKSGLLTRWSRQTSMSEFSTTTLFFLPDGEVARLVEAGRDERAPFVVAVADSIRAIRAREVRDIRAAADRDRVRAEITAARNDLVRAAESGAALLAATEAAVGADAMAKLRRSLLP